MKVSYFETGRYVRRRTCRANGRCRPRAYDPAVGAEALRGMVERVKFVETAGLRLGQPVRAPLLAAHPDAVAGGLRHLARRARGQDQDRDARADRAGQQSDPRRRGTGDARYAGAGPHRGRAAARHHQRVPQLRPEPEGGARAHRRGDGADPQGVDRAAAVRLAGAAFPVSHRLDLAAPAAAASADLCAGHQRRGRRVRRAPPHRPRRVVRHVRDDGAGDAATTASAAPITAGSRDRTTSSTAPT